jgi:hypothetical protein
MLKQIHVAFATFGTVLFVGPNEETVSFTVLPN